MKKGCFVLGSVFAGSRVLPAAVVKELLPASDLDFLDSALHVIRREDWTNVLPKPWLLRQSGGFDRITIHHSGRHAAAMGDESDVGLGLNGILDSHVKRGYGDMGYHFVVDRAGRLWEGRSLAYEGAHVAGQNDANIGVMNLGNFEEQDPTDEQLSATHLLVQNLILQFRVKRHRIYGHRDLGHSVCPGQSLYSHVVRMKNGEE